MHFNSDINSSVKLTRVDNGKSVEIIYNHSSIPANPLMNELMQKTITNTATKEEKETFGKLWQERVEKILKNYKEVITIL